MQARRGWKKCPRKNRTSPTWKKSSTSSSSPIPPTKILYAAPDVQNSGVSSTDTDREKWASAHLLPITVPADVPELSTLSQDRDEILAGIRSGFAAAYDALAPVVGLRVDGPDSLDGMKVAELVFPAVDAPIDESVLEQQFALAGVKLGKHNEMITLGAQVKDDKPRRRARFRTLLSIRSAFRFNKIANESADVEGSTLSAVTLSAAPTTDSSLPVQDADTVFSFLPGVQQGSAPLVAERLQSYLESNSYVEEE